MEKALAYTYLPKKPKARLQELFNQIQQAQYLNIFVVTFEGLKQAQKNLVDGDPYLYIIALVFIYFKYFFEEISKLLSNKKREFKMRKNKFEVQGKTRFIQDTHKNYQKCKEIK